MGRRHRVRGLWSLSLDDAPPIEDIGVSRARVQRHGHISLGDLEYEAAERFTAKRRPSRWRSDRSENALVPIEDSNSEEYEITRPESGERAVRREARLVRDYAHFVAAYPSIPQELEPGYSSEGRSGVALGSTPSVALAVKPPRARLLPAHARASTELEPP